MLQERSKAEQKYFDIALSGTSATVVIQLPIAAEQRLIIAYVGNSSVTIQKREKIPKERDFSTKPHSPNDQNEKIRIYNN